MNYSVTGDEGNRRVKFACSRCSASLALPLAKAGQRIQCQMCGTEIRVPGAAELEVERAATAPGENPARAADGKPERPVTPAPAPATAARLAPVAHAGARSKGSTPDYADILQGNSMLRMFAGVVAAVGWVAVIVATVGLAYGVYENTQGDRGSLITGLTVFGVGLAYALPCFVIAVMLRMYGALAVAVRDIARNSFPTKL